VDGHSFAAALMHVLAVVTPPAPGVKKLSVAFSGPVGGRRLAAEEQYGRCTADRSKYYWFYLHSGK
jgi:hypothetical protein